MRPEERREILTAVARHAPPGPDALRGPLARVDDWPNLVRHVLAHGLPGLALERWKDPALADVVPPATVEALRETVRANAARNLLHKRELVRLRRALPDEVPILLAKGVHLAEYDYPRPSMRAMTDVDLFARPGDVEVVERTLLDLGFVLEERRRRPREWWIENFQHLEPFVSPAGVRVEVHLRNAGRDMPYRMDMDGVWERAVTREYGGERVCAMTPEDHLAFLVLHLYVHEIHLVKTVGLADLDRTIRGAGDFDWKGLLERAGAEGFLFLLHLPLRLAAVLLDAPVPGEVLDRTRPPDFADDDLAFLSDYCFRDDVEREMVPAAVSKALAARGGRVRIVRRMLLPSGRELRERYNLPDGSPRVFVYRLVHPLALAIKWSGFLRRLIAGKRQRRLVSLSGRVAGWTRPPTP